LNKIIDQLASMPEKLWSMNYKTLNSKIVKTALLKSLLVILFMVAGKTMFAQSYDVYISNRALTAANQLEFDVYIVNNGATDAWALRSYQCGYKFATAFVNGGTLSGAYVSGSSDFPASLGKSFGFSWNASATVLNQSANTGSSCPGGLVTSTPKKIGRFRVTNSVNFGCADDGISIMRSGTGHLLFAVTKYNSAVCSDNNDKSNTTVTSGATTYVSGTGITMSASASAPATLNCGSNVNVTVSATGGFAATSYTGAGTFSRGEGTWNFTVSDDRGCQASASVTIIQGALPTSSLTAVSACENYSWNGTTYSSSGFYTATLTNVRGCDSSAVVNLTITPRPAQPSIACYQTATFNGTSCQWEVTGTQPTQPTLACYESASFNGTTCQWVVTGTQPSQPTLACYQSATFNGNTCQWDVTGTQPARPNTACYQTATFNATTCQWDVTGTQPSQPTLACYQSATFNGTSCQWDVTGTQPAQPSIECYQSATFNGTSCQWVVTGT